MHRSLGDLSEAPWQRRRLSSETRVPRNGLSEQLFSTGNITGKSILNL